MMTSLSIIAPDTTDSCYIYRSWPFEKLGFHTESFSGRVGFQLHRAVINADVVLLQRPFTAQHVSIAHTIKDAGKILLLDWDDSYVNIPSYNANAHHFKDCLPHVAALSKLADAVTVTSDALKREIESYGAKRVVKIPNAIDDSLKGIYRAPTRSKSLLWRGAVGGHQADMESGKQTFFDFAAKGYELIFMGDKPPWSYQVNHRHFTVSDYCNYLCTLARLAPEYVFVPLVDNLFNQGKSDISALEAWLAGAKLIHSNIGEFKNLPECGQVRWLSEVNHLRKDLLCSLL
jgi:hypothetical protein